MQIINKLSETIINKTALIIRHADRNKIPASELGTEILLNKKGEKNAIEFGKKLKNYPINKIFTSPINRCIQTAEFIKTEIGENIEIETTKILGSPGIFVYNEKLASETFFKLGLEGIYNNLINNISIPGMKNLKTTSAILEEFVNKNTRKNKLTIFVTHDYFIAFLEYYFYKKIYPDKILVDFLGGIIL